MSRKGAAPGQCIPSFLERRFVCLVSARPRGREHVAKLGIPPKREIGRASDTRFEAVRSQWLVSIRLAEREPGA